MKLMDEEMLFAWFLVCVKVCYYMIDAEGCITCD